MSIHCRESSSILKLSVRIKCRQITYLFEYFWIIPLACFPKNPSFLHAAFQNFRNRAKTVGILVKELADQAEFLS